MKFKALLLTSLREGSEIGQGADPTGPRKGWGGEGGIQVNIQISGLKCSAWLQLSLNSTLRLRPGFYLRATELRNSESQTSAPTVQCAMGSSRWL